MENRRSASAADSFTAKKLLRIVGVFAIIASAVSQEYGSGINFVATNSLTVYPSIENLVPLAMLVTGVLYLPKVILYMRFSRVMSRAGGTYVWISRSLSLPIGFVISFLWWIGLVFAIGVLAYSFGSFLATGLSDVGLTGAQWFATPRGHIVIGLIAIWLIFFIHLSGVHSYGRLVTIALIFVVLNALLVIGYGFLTKPETFISAVQSQYHVQLISSTSGHGPTIGTFLSTCTLFIFAYGGISAAPLLGGEAKNAETTMPRGILFAWLIVLALFSLVAFAVFHAAPWWAIVQLIHAGHSSVTTTPGLIGLLSPHWLSALLNLVVALIVGKTLAPQMLGTSRMAFAFAQDKIFPQVFTRTAKTGSPSAALVLTAIVGSLGLIESALVGWSIGVTVRSISILAGLIFLGIGVLNLRFNSKYKNLPWASSIGTGVGMMVAAVLAILFGTLLIGSVLVVPKQPFLLQPAVQAIIVLIIGVVIYMRAAAVARRRDTLLHAVSMELPID